MKKSILAAAILAALGATAGGASAQKTTYGDVARVISATPHTERSPAPRDCGAAPTRGYPAPAGYRTIANDSPATPPCDAAPQGRERIVGYDVRYQYNGREFSIRMPYDPGPEMPVNVDVRPPAASVSIGPKRPSYRGTY